jgi:DNA-binding CsgD family transcriptional regulator
MSPSAAKSPSAEREPAAVARGAAEQGPPAPGHAAPGHRVARPDGGLTMSTESDAASRVVPAATHVLIVDNHELFSTALRMALCQHGLDAHQVAPTSIDAVLAVAGRLPAGLVLLDLLADGYRAARIAKTFVVSLATVRAQIRAILCKLEVYSQLEAVALLHYSKNG